MKTVKLDNNTKQDLLANLLKRSPAQYREYEDKVAVIVNEVRNRKANTKWHHFHAESKT